MNLRNIAIIAHVEHGKTTLVDKLLKQAGTLGDRAPELNRVMDSNDLERERGITILAKNTAIQWRDHRINIVDTPGHADFGGEVERILSMVDSVLLLVDAVDGPMPQTRFVTQKAFEQGLNPIVVINKVDKPNCTPDEVHEMVFELMFNLEATEDQLDFVTVYGSAKQGWMGPDWKNPTDNITHLLDTIIDVIPEPESKQGTSQLLVTSLDYSSFIGRIAIGRVHRGSLKTNQPIVLIKRDGSKIKSRIKELFVFEGLESYPAIH